MAKRFTDTEKWNKKFVRSLKPAYKLLWFYILDECNTAGIWDVDIDVAEIKTGVKLNEEDALKTFLGKIQPIDGGTKWFIPAFIEFQYGDLAENNRAHTKAIALLKKFNLLTVDLKIKPLASPLASPYTSPLQGATDGAMVEVEDKVEEQVIIDPDNFFEKFNKWIADNAPRVAKMREPFTEDEFIRLKGDFTTEQIQSLLKQMHNYKKLYDNLSANLTFRNWAKRHYTPPVPQEEKKVQI